MRILHTSDWHLGQYFYGQSRQAEHQKFLDWLIEVVIQRSVDVVIVAGDVFDIGAPPSYARALYYQFIVKLQDSGVQTVVVAGNHDSVATLTESKDLLACLNTHVVPGILSSQSDQVIVIGDGSDQRPGAIICAVPFLRAREVQFSTAGQTGTEKQYSLQKAIAEHYQHIYKIALEKQAQLTKPLPIIITGHLATIGAKLSDSVRDIYIGTLSAFSSEYFPPADYIALGHIHRYQKVSTDKAIYYCGSPIALSFDEANQQKVVLVAEFEEAQLSRVEKIDVPCFQALHQISGSLNDIQQRINELYADHRGQGTIWLEIIVKTADYLGDLQQQIQGMIKEKPFEVLKIRRYKQVNNADIKDTTGQTLQELKPEHIFEKRLANEDWQGQQQVLTKVRQAFTEIVNTLGKP